MGRPTKYQEAYAEQARKLCLLGYTDVDLADFFEVSEATINNWKHEYPEFLESIKKGKAVADGEVVAKLFHRATGYEHPEDDIRSVDGTIVITPTVKHYPPDTTAAIFWLKNRQPKTWRDKQEVEQSGDLGLTVNIKRFTPDGDKSS
ncbi:TPA: terminase [Klebsiella oxytoca]|nr:terminase [Klebsiella oxytoca]HCQ8704996.1 terminase [Klebsiella oxytoca]